MTAIIIFIGLIIGLNSIPLLIKKELPKSKKFVSIILPISTILFSLFTTLTFVGYRLRGIYLFPIIVLTFICATLYYFATFKNTIKKGLTIIVLTPTLIIAVFMLLFTRTLKEFKLDEKYKIQVTNGGLLACGENLKVTKSSFLIFDKEVYENGNTCLKGITKIETIAKDTNQFEILIYHDGQFDSENPYEETIKKNGW